MFTFISFWRTAAIVLCDLASTAYYIGGIVESQIGKAAPWFILGVMLFSYTVRSIYIESSAMFVRGGVYRIVKEAMGGGLARLAVSALLFDFILTGPVSSVTAGQYIIGLINDLFELGRDSVLLDYKNVLVLGDRDPRDGLLLAGQHQGNPRIERPGSQDHDGDDRHGRDHDRLVPGHDRRPARETHVSRPRRPTFPRRSTPHGKPVLDPFGKQVDPLGFIGETKLGHSLRPDNIQGSWLSLIGVIGIMLVLRPLDPGDERRGNAGPGLSRGRKPQAQELQLRLRSLSSSTVCSSRR